jgi:hypothetical protein
VNLLGEYTRARICDEPLGLKLVLSRTADPGGQVRALKEVGDTSLYVVGFFAESLDRKLVQGDYYRGLGETAYRELAARLQTCSAAEVYRELADKFPRFVDVLNEVRAQVNLASADVVELYRQWLQTRSEWIERRLRALGVIMPQAGSQLVQ